MSAPGFQEQIAALRRQWEMVSQALPPGESVEELLQRLPEEQRPAFREQFEGMCATKRQIEERLRALEAEPTPNTEEQQRQNWQHLLMKIMLFGWPTPEDFSRLEGRSAETWPASLPHPSVAGWLPFADWCERYWVRGGRVTSVLALDPVPELADRLGASLKMACVTTSQHDLNLLSFLRQRPGNILNPAASLGDTGHRIVLEMPAGAVHAVLLGHRAREKWGSLPPAMLSWMLSELAARTLYLAVEGTEPWDAPAGSGWVATGDGQDTGIWRIWKSSVPLPGNPPPSDWDARCRRITLGGFESDRKAILTAGGGQLAVFHGSVQALSLEREAWRSIEGLHPMLPRLASGSAGEFLRLFPGEGARWMPCGKRGAECEAEELLSLLELLAERSLVPPGLNAADFLSVGGRAVLGRIGFQGHRDRGDHLVALMETMLGWRMTEIPAGRLFRPTDPPSPGAFPAQFRDLADKALASASFRHLTASLKGGNALA